MKRIKIKAILCLLLCALILLSGCGAKTGHGTSPEPDPGTEGAAAEPTTGLRPGTLKRLFVLDDETNAGLKAAAEICLELFDASGYELKLAFGKEEKIRAGDIVLAASDSLQNEEYRVTVTAQTVRLTFGSGEDCPFFEGGESCRGALYAVQALLKRIAVMGDAATDPCEFCAVPETRERTLMLDCARKLWSVDFIKNLISEMAWMGFNALELHMTEEQGIRFNIWQSESGEAVRDVNGNDFSFICGGTKVSWNPDYAEDTDAFYCREQVEEIVSFARSRRVEIIPAIDLPGHSVNLISRCNAKAQNGGFSFSRGGRVFESTPSTAIQAAGSGKAAVDVSSEFAREMSFAVAEAYADFFHNLGCRKINIGADEVSVDDSGWESYAAERGGESQHDAFIIYLNSLTGLLRNMGYTVRAFNDSLFKNGGSVELDQAVEICCWSGGGKTPAQLAAEGRKIYNCTENFCYYALRTNRSGVDARDKNCSTWSFGHSTAERIFAGCGEAGCPGCDGWCSSRFWGSECENPAGAYFLIWGDYAALDDERSIMLRADDYNLTDRLWASSAKMLDGSINEKMSYEQFAAETAAYRFAPGVSF